MDDMGSPQTMSWEAAETLLKERPGVRVSSLSWDQAGKFIFRAKAFVPVPGLELTEAEKAAGCTTMQQETISCLWFRTRDGRVGPYPGSPFGENRDDWIEGPSPGKPDAVK